ncbi:hypothetical protein M2150_000515 [Lachnospiraceae bacterium PM6-15]|uniref:hypothetical protein n=1 Tax=Ohessyouella blattaphilus TaxID=2949333 RepID=UPI003E32642B
MRNCNLCGGNVDSQGVCKECGMRYQENETVAEINNEAKPVGTAQNSSTKPQKTWASPQQVAQKNKGKKNKGKKTKLLAGIITILLALASILPNVMDIYRARIEPHIELPKDFNLNFDDDGEAFNYDPYKYTEKTLPETGQEFAIELAPGFYVVGRDLPEGTYVATTVDDFDTVQVRDSENMINLFEYSYEEENYLDDLRLFEGAVVFIEGENPIHFRSENASSEWVAPLANPNAGEPAISQKLTGKKILVGEDIKPGTYDITLIRGEYLFLNLKQDVGGEEYNLDNFEITTIGKRNVVLAEGMYLFAEDTEDELEILLTPSQTILSEDPASDAVLLYSNYVVE